MRTARAYVFVAAVLSFARTVAAAPYDLDVVAQSAPATMGQSARVAVALTLANRGTTTWDPARSFNVSYHWLAPDGAVIVIDGERTPLPHAVAPGQQIELRAQLSAPKQTGIALLQWDVVQESVVWIAHVDPTPPRPVRVKIVPAVVSHAFTVIEQQLPRLVWTSATRDVRLVVRNDGSEPWSPNRPIHLSYHWIHTSASKAIYNGERSVLPRAAGGGERVAAVVRLRMPPRPGLYRLQWDMVEEGVTWFSDRDPTPEPARLVMVLPSFSRAAASTFAGLILLVIAMYAARAHRLVSAIAVADLLLLGIALVVKQAALADELQPGAPFAGWLLIGTVALIVIVIALLPPRARPWIAILVNAVVSLVILADVLHFRFFGDVISVATLRSGGQLPDVGASVAALLKPRDWWLLADLLAALLLAIALRGSLRVAGARPARVLAAVLVPLLIPAAVQTRRNALASEGAFAQVFENAIVIGEAGVLNWHLHDAWTSVRTRLTRSDVPPARRREIAQWFRRSAPRRAGRPPWFAAARGRDLIMIQVESMQGFLIDYVVDGQEITPNLNRWRRNTVFASSCADQTAQGRTSDGEFTTQVSLLPLAQGAVSFLYASNRYHAIARILEAHGYHTLSAVPFDGAFWNRHLTHRQYGYRTTFFDDAFQPGVNVGWGLNDRDFLLQMVPRLAAQPHPFAAYLITLSDHHPFDSFPDQLKTLRLGRLEGTPFGNYLHAMHYFDAAFGAFVDALATHGALRNTVVAVWGDHSAGFEWNAEMAHLIGHRATEQELYLTRTVPLLIAVPDANLPAVHDAPCGQIDVSPTLLALLGVDGSAYPLLGRNLLGASAPAPIAQQFTVWRDREHLFLPRGPEASRGLCYEIPSLQQVAGATCSAGYTEAREQVEVSRDVIEHDLQTTILSGE